MVTSTGPSNNDDEDSVIPIGTLVEIHGLQSEGGKKLNGGQGFILKKPETVQGNVRYPVKVYAVLKENKEEGEGTTTMTKVLSKFIDDNDVKGIKMDNLTVLDNQKQDIFKEIAVERITLLGAQLKHKASLPWIETFCKIWPDGDGHYNIVLHYSDLLNAIEYKPKQALEVLLGIADQVPSTYENYDKFLCQFAHVCFRAGSHFDEAFEKACLIPTDTPEGKKMAQAALLDVLAGVSKRNHQDVKREQPEMFEIQLQASKALYEVSPTLNNLYNIGCAYCLKGDNFTGAQYYRRTLAEAAAASSSRRGSLLSIPRSRLEGDLVTAQLQCPGMPLEKYVIVSRTGEQYVCVHKDDRDKCAMKCRTDVGETDRPQADTYLKATDESGLTLMQFPVPNGPDDPNVFPQSFLDTLKE